MNDAMFIELRRCAKDCGLSVVDMLNRQHPHPALKGRYTSDEKGKKCAVGDYRDFKDANFARLYNGGLIVAGKAEHKRVAEADAIRTGRHPEYIRAQQREFDKLVNFGTRYGTGRKISPPEFQNFPLTGTCTARMTSTQPNPSQIPKRDDSMDALSRMYEHVKKVMYETACLSPYPTIVLSDDDYRKLAAEPLFTQRADTLAPDSIFGMKVVKQRDYHKVPDGTRVAFIGLETYGSEFAFGGLNPKDPIVNKTAPVMIELGQQATSAELLAAANEAAEREAKVKAAQERDAHLGYLAALAQATQTLVNAIRYPSNSFHFLGRYAKELKPLATELGAKIVPTNDEGRYLVIAA